MRSPGGPAPYLRPAHSVIEPAPTSHGPARAWRDAEPVLDLDERTWQDMIDVNLTGTWHTLKPPYPTSGPSAAADRSSSPPRAPPSCRRPGSVTTTRPWRAWSHSRAPSPRRSGSNLIRVNCVNPRNVDTPMIDNEVTRRLFLPHLEHPTRKDAEKPDSTYVAVNVLPVPWVSPGDVSNVVTFLASDASEHLTGTPHPRRCRLPDQEMTQIRPVVGQGCSQARRTTARRETTQ